jgi:hypothetical protein
VVSPPVKDFGPLEACTRPQSEKKAPKYFASKSFNGSMALANQPQSSCGKADSFQGTIDFISSQSIFSPHNLKVVNGSYGEEIHAATSQPKLLTITMDEDYQDDSCKDLTAAKTRAITYAESHCKSQEHLPKSGRLQLLAGLKNTDISVVNESRTSHYKGRPTYT